MIELATTLTRPRCQQKFQRVGTETGEAEISLADYLGEVESAI